MLSHSDNSAMSKLLAAALVKLLFHRELGNFSTYFYITLSDLQEIKAPKNK